MNLGHKIVPYAYSSLEAWIQPWLSSFGRTLTSIAFSRRFILEVCHSRGMLFSRHVILESCHSRGMSISRLHHTHVGVSSVLDSNETS